MRTFLIIKFSFFIILYCSLAFGDVHVRGYFKKNGTYVAPHYRSSPNHTTIDNWSTKGNVNPYTGEAGSKSITSGEGTFINTNSESNSNKTYENTDLMPYKIYKWTDKNNITHYSDQLPP